MDISTQLTALEQRAFVTYVPSEETAAEVAAFCNTLPRDDPSKPTVLNLYVLLCARKALDTFVSSLEGEVNILEATRNLNTLAYMLQISWIVAANGYTANFVELFDAIGRCFSLATKAQALLIALDQIEHGDYQIEANILANLEEEKDLTRQLAAAERNSVIANLYTREARIINRQVEAIIDRIARLAETVITTLTSGSETSAELIHMLEIFVRNPQCAETTLFTHSLHDLGHLLRLTKIDEETYEMNFTPIN